MLEYVKERDRDFMESCRRAKRELLASDGEIDVMSVIRRAIYGGAPSYYVGFERAERMLRRYESGRMPSTARTEKTLMWSELSERVGDHMRRHRLRRRGSAIAMVLAEGNAGRYFISETYALRLYYRLQHDSHRRRRRRLL